MIFRVQSNDLNGEVYQLRDFSRPLLHFASQFGGVPVTDNFSFPDWEAAFQFLVDTIARVDSPQLIVIDEFTYLIRNNAAVTSVLQKTWDPHLSQQSNLRLVLTGSLIGMMEREVLSYQAPVPYKNSVRTR